MTIRLLLVDDHAVVRAGLHAVLETESDFEVVGEAAAGMPAIDQARKLAPTVVVTDLLLPDMDGVEVVEAIRKELPDTQVVVLTSVSDEDASLVRAIRAGAIGYVLKNVDVQVLVKTIREAAEGRAYLSAQASARLMQEMRSPKLQFPLTTRERDVLREIGLGRTNKEIARSLHIAETTVKSHVGAILDKLDVQSRTQAALQALQGHIVSTHELDAA